MAEHTAGARSNGRLSRAVSSLGKPLRVPAQNQGHFTPYRKLLSGADADTLEFEVFGAVCRRNKFAEHFNFKQRWSPFPHVPMSTMLADSPQTLTLALNILDQFFRSRDEGSPTRRADPRAINLMESFADEILAPLAGCSWHLPTESIGQWTVLRLSQFESGRTR